MIFDQNAARRSQHNPVEAFTLTAVRKRISHIFCEAKCSRHKNICDIASHTRILYYKIQLTIAVMVKATQRTLTMGFTSDIALPLKLSIGETAGAPDPAWLDEATPDCTAATAGAGVSAAPAAGIVSTTFCGSSTATELAGPGRFSTDDEATSLAFSPADVGVTGPVFSGPLSPITGFVLSGPLSPMTEAAAEFAAIGLEASTSEAAGDGGASLVSQETQLGFPYLQVPEPVFSEGSSPTESSLRISGGQTGHGH